MNRVICVWENNQSWLSKKKEIVNKKIGKLSCEIKKKLWRERSSGED